MPTQWYGQEDPAVDPHSQAQAPMNPMHHAKFHHGPSAASGPAMTSMQNQAAYQRSATPIARPPSSASTSSASSYLTVPGSSSAPASSSTVDHNNQGPLPPMHHPHQAGARPTGHGRYPMPQPHSNGGAGPLIRPIRRLPMPPRNYLFANTMGHPQAITNGQPLRNLQKGAGAASHDPSRNHRGPHAPFGNHMAPHNQNMHHHHRRFMHMGVTGPYGTRRGNYHPNMPHHMQSQRHHMPLDHQQQFPQRFARNFRSSPEATEIDRQAISRSPSPPPAPPTSSTTTNAAARTQGRGSTKSPTIVERVVSDDSTSPSALSNNPLRERQANKNNSPVKKVAKEDFTADAASILLQLGAIVQSNNHNNAEKPKKIEDSTSSSDQENLVQNKKTQDESKCSIKSANTSLSVSSSSIANEPATTQESHSCDRSEATHDSAPDLTTGRSTDSIDTQDSDFPALIPEKFPKRLALPHDDSKLNSLHCYLRSELLEIFVVQKSENKSPTHSPGSSVGRVGLRCVHCAMMKRKREDRDEAPMAVFYPKSIAEIYRLVTSWQRCHLRKCRNLPPNVRSQWQSLRETDKSRGKTHYWVVSAKAIGLVDCHSRAGGIRFGPNTVAYMTNLEEELNIATSSLATTAKDDVQMKSVPICRPALPI